jgi:hypothetical protein
MESNSSIEAKLSTKGFGHLPNNAYEKDFAFIVGKTQYQCPSLIAAFLSSRIGRLQANDPTLRDFVIETEDPQHYFREFLCLSEGVAVKVPSTARGFFRSLFVN